MAKRRLRFDSLEQRLCLSSPTLQTTITLPTGAWLPTEYRASPIFYDIFHTGKDDVIAVASGAQLVAYAENPDGSAKLVVSYQIPPALPSGLADIKSTPLIVTDPRTGRQDLFAAMGRNEKANLALEDGRVFGWDLQTGKFLPGWSQGVSSGHDPSGFGGVEGSLTSGDLEGNGIPDIVVTSFSHEVTAIRLDGSILWQWDSDDTIASGAVVADINRDGKPEVVVGGDSSDSIYFKAGGWVNVLSNTGQLIWRKVLPGEVTWSSPVVADLLNNGNLDIVIGTGLNYSFTLTGPAQIAATEAGDFIYAFDPFGNMLPGWPYHTTFNGDTQGHEVLAAPAVADLLGNGQLDVVALDRAGYIHAIAPNGQALPGFVGGKRVAPTVSQSLLSDNWGSPTIADINGDGKPDIIAGSGPFISAFDPQGNLIPIATTPIGSGSLPEGIDIAPAVGNFDGTPALTMAVETYDALSPGGNNRPDKILIFQLPLSTLTPPWPMIRRTVSGDAVARSPVYDQQYVAQTFNTLLGSQPPAPTLQLYVSALNTDSTNLLSTAQLIAISAPVVNAEIAKIYQGFLGHAPDAFALSFWGSYLATNSYRQMESLIASSAEFATRAGNSYSQEVVQLYRAILNRAPTTGELNFLVGANLPMSTLAAAILNSSEAITDQFNTVVQAMFGPGTQALMPPDAVAAYSYDIHTGMSEAAINSEMLASAANLATTNFVASYIQSLYGDILVRNASHSDVAFWLNQIDSGTVAFSNLASILLNSLEAREDYVQAEFFKLLGHGADQGTLASLANYVHREDIAVLIVGSPEYFAKNGGTNASFVAAAFRDLANIGVGQDVINSFVAQMNAGLATTTSIAHSIIFGGNLYFSALAVSQLTQYVPLESQGVLRTGELPVNAPGQPINPDPNVLAYVQALYAGGFTDEQVLSILFNSPQYDAKVSFFRGLYRTPGVRN
jgi:FG-GAP-like repeat